MRRLIHAPSGQGGRPIRRRLGWYTAAGLAAIAIAATVGVTASGASPKSSAARDPKSIAAPATAKNRAAIRPHADATAVTNIMWTEDLSSGAVSTAADVQSQYGDSPILYGAVLQCWDKCAPPPGSVSWHLVHQDGTDQTLYTQNLTFDPGSAEPGDASYSSIDLSPYDIGVGNYQIYTHYDPASGSPYAPADSQRVKYEVQPRDITRGLTLTAQPTTVSRNEKTHLQVTAPEVPNHTAPTGFVQFSVVLPNGTRIPINGPVGLNYANGKATWETDTTLGATGPLPQTFAIDAEYQPGTDPRYTRGFSNKVSVTLADLTTTISLTSERNPAALDDFVTVGAKITTGDAERDRQLTGVVKFYGDAADPKRLLGTSTVTQGQSAFGEKGSYFGLGTSQITACYYPSEDQPSNSCTAAPVAQVVNRNPTTTTVTVNNPTASVGLGTVLFTATVGSGDETQDGPVSFYLDGSTSPAYTVEHVDPSRDPVTAVWETGTLTAGRHTVTAKFGGDASHAPSESATPATVDVTKEPTTVQLAPTAVTAKAGDPVGFTATVEGPQPQIVNAAAGDGLPTPTGTVTFLVDGTAAGTGTLNAHGIATWSTKALKVGTRAVTARYDGDAGFDPSTSSAATVTVTAAPPAGGGSSGGSGGGHSSGAPHGPATTGPHGPATTSTRRGGSSADGGLASTGVKVSLLLGGALVLLLAGGAFVLLGRNRRTSRHGA
jgi:hypothetical protein